MDLADPTSSGGRFETFDANTRFVVVRDDEGYGVWRLDELDDGDPIDRFADDERGYGAAATRWKELTAVARRSVWLRTLIWALVVSAIIWVVSSAISALLYLQVGATMFEGTGLFDTLVRWSQLISLVAQPLTLGAFAVYVGSGSRTDRPGRPSRYTEEIEPLPSYDASGSSRAVRST